MAAPAAAGAARAGAASARARAASSAQRARSAGSKRKPVDASTGVVDVLATTGGPSSSKRRAADQDPVSGTVGQQSGGGRESSSRPSSANSRTSSSRSGSRRSYRAPRPAREASGFVLAALLWGWVILPWVNPPRGMSRGDSVKAVLMAKFLNKSLDGDPL